mgnify:CR=1 FL=1
MLLTHPVARRHTRLLGGAIALSLLTGVLAAALLVAASAQSPGAPPVPAVLSHIATDADGQLVFRHPGGDVYTLREREPAWTLDQVLGSPAPTANGIAFDFGKPDFKGRLFFGLIPYHDTRFPQPVYRTSVAIAGGKAEVNIAGTLGDRYDMVGWRKAGTGIIGYRIVGADGSMIYDGRIRFTAAGPKGPFEIATTILEGPFVANVTPTSAVVWFRLNRPDACSVVVSSREVPCAAGAAHQELQIDGLAPDREYPYAVRYGGHQERYAFRTAPKAGSRKPFTFGYASDSRGGVGGGERNFMGPNAHIMRRLMSVAYSRNSAFTLFTGDLVSGYVTSPDTLRMEMANWRRAVEPQARWMPIYTGQGNHEVVMREFVGPNNRTVRIDRFPYATEGTEAVFAAEVVNPENGPTSEDGASYDPNSSAIDFPSYRENVYWFQYDNAAFVVLNSNYWFSPSVSTMPEANGNPHAYLMDNQMAWLAETLQRLERDRSIDHVFVTVHTPIFPNGGHVGDDMWYGGDNTVRPVVAGTPVAKGIIERRDDLLTLIQRHGKVVAILTGDEHNYNRLRLDQTVPIYPDGWTGPRVTLSRPFHQINNGAAGAPYYAQEQTPWSAFVRGFSTQNALCLIHVRGKRVQLEVVNPETLEVLERAELR